MADLELGIRFDGAPVPVVAEATRQIAAGAVSIGVEYRVLDEAVIAATFTQA